MTKIKVLLADDHAMVRSGLRILIDTQPDMMVVGEAASADELIEKVTETSAEVIVLDVSMPGGGIQAIPQLTQHSTAVKVLVLTVHDDRAYLRASVEAGASGYIVKHAAGTELVTAIRVVHEGHTYIDASLTRSLLEGAFFPKSARDCGRASAPVDSLSPREREVLEFIAFGHTNQEIADRLTLSVKSVETYRARLAEKLGLRTRVDIVKYALETGILVPGKHTP
jgi:two-component system, NarL family, response regulator NreC